VPEEKHKKTQVGIAGVSAELRTERFPNTSEELLRCDNPFGSIVSA
jgi:hypothetical protein